MNATELIQRIHDAGKSYLPVLLVKKDCGKGFIGKRKLTEGMSCFAAPHPYARQKLQSRRTQDRAASLQKKSNFQPKLTAGNLSSPADLFISLCSFIFIIICFARWKAFSLLRFRFQPPVYSGSALSSFRSIRLCSLYSYLGATYTHCVRRRFKCFLFAFQGKADETF